MQFLKAFFNVCFTLCFIHHLSAQFDTLDYSLHTHEETLMCDIDEHAFHTHIDGDSMNIWLPDPKGQYEEYLITATHTVSTTHTERYDLHTFHGVNIKNPIKKLAFDISPTRLFAYVSHGDQSYTIERRDAHKSYEIKYIEEDKFTIPCLVNKEFEIRRDHHNHGIRDHDHKRTYRLAFTVDSGYALEFGGSPYNHTNVLNTIASGVNMINLITLRDLGIDFMIVSDEQSVYTTAADDPFDPNDMMNVINSNTGLLDGIYGQDNYDVGHALFWGWHGGLAYVNVLCYNPLKGGGMSGTIGSMYSYWIKYVAHEIGHQLGSRHKFSAEECQNSTDNHRYEPGSGTTIMSYAGICDGASNVTDDYYHYSSIEQIQNAIDDNTCGTAASLVNHHAPVVNAGSDMTIPKDTPFFLVGSATDDTSQDTQDGLQPMTYNWVQYDGSSAATSGDPDCQSTDAPLFKYTIPNGQNYRYFPVMDSILYGNNQAEYEVLPCAARTLNFKLVARDNHVSHGRTASDAMVITVAETGPLRVTAPNGNETINADAPMEVKWDVNNTDNHTPTVDILYSRDDGQSYEILSNDTPNDGIQEVDIPSYTSSTSRIMVQAHTGDYQQSSTYFDISDGAFSVEASALPLKFIYFRGTWQKGNINLTWGTEQEINVKYFEIQKYVNHHWMTIEKVQAQNALHRNEYVYTDEQTLLNEQIYRIKEVDFDDQYGYSHVISVVANHTPQEIEIFPNPAGHQINLKHLQTAALLEVYNWSGTLLLQTPTTVNKPIDIAVLPAGSYIAKIISEDKVQILKFEKM